MVTSQYTSTHQGRANCPRFRLFSVHQYQGDRVSFLRFAVMVCLLCAVLLAGCTMEESAEPNTEASPTVPETSVPSDSTTAPAPDAAPSTIEPTVQAAILDTIAADLSVPADNLQVIRSEPQTWPDGCLGLGEADEICTQALVQGWLVTVTDGETTWRYRTDQTGSQVRLES